MASAKAVAEIVSNGSTEMQPAKVNNTLQGLLKSVNIRHRFEEVLGEKAAGFISSIINVANSNRRLQMADPFTIISAAAVAASLDLPINPSLGFAHIIPYSDGESGKIHAQFQMGWRGFVQLAMRSGQYKTMNVAEVFDGELILNNRITGEMVFDLAMRKNDNVVGYVAYFKLLNGFEKYYYMTKEECERHGKRYSKSYSSGLWQKDFGTMAKKTVLKNLLSKFGILSIEMQMAIQTDQAVIKEIDGKVEYPDNPELPENVEKKEGE